MIEIIMSTESFDGDVRDILKDNWEAVEPGLVVLERDFRLDEDLVVDYLARDTNGKPVVVLLGDSEDGAALIQRLLLILRGLQQNRFFLNRIFREQSFDFSKPPRAVVLSASMTDELVYCLESINAAEVIPCEYSFLKLEDRTYFTVTSKSGVRALRAARVGDAVAAGGRGEKAKSVQHSAAKPKAAEAPAEIKNSPPPAAVPADKNPAAPPGDNDAEQVQPPDMDAAFSAEVFFQTAREKIKRISPKINENRDGSMIRFKINDKVLSSVAVQSNVCFVFLGDKKDKAIKITSDQVLNETLNQIYKLYITQFGSAKAS